MPSSGGRRANLFQRAQLLSSLRWRATIYGETVLTIDMRRLASPAATRLLLGMSRAWKMSVTKEARLLALPRPVWSKCIRGVPVAIPSKALKRIAFSARIFEAINMLLPPDRADAWMRKPNSAAAFKGRSALDLMLGDGQAGIDAVLQHLLAEIYG